MAAALLLFYIIEDEGQRKRLAGESGKSVGVVEIGTSRN
jgi:hypothetical protein